MIEIEVFNRNPDKDHKVSIWIRGELVHSATQVKPDELVELRDALHNELLWLNSYLREQGLEK